jgi:excisionase family DNA binding protein
MQNESDNNTTHGLQRFLIELLSATPADQERMIRAAKAGTTADAETDCRLLTISAAAKLAGVSRPTVYGLLASGALSQIRFSDGANPRIALKDLRALIEARKQKAEVTG